MFAGISRTEEECTVPDMFCHTCFLKLQRVRKASEDGTPCNPLVAKDAK